MTTAANANAYNSNDAETRGRIGYLSGCFDMFHIGHLNIIRRAKERCDYLVCGVHRDASHKGGGELAIPLEDRLEIVKAIRYVDQVIVSEGDDAKHWDDVHYTHLFVGSDYEGSERFKRFERELGPKGVTIVFLPYTEGVSSTLLRQGIYGGRS